MIHNHNADNGDVNRFLISFFVRMNWPQVGPFCRHTLYIKLC